jgi:hypothetical protein
MWLARDSQVVHQSGPTALQTTPHSCRCGQTSDRHGDGVGPQSRQGRDLSQRHARQERWHDDPQARGKGPYLSMASGRSASTAPTGSHGAPVPPAPRGPGRQVDLPGGEARGLIAVCAARRPLTWHSRGHGFDPHQLHQLQQQLSGALVETQARCVYAVSIPGRNAMKPCGTSWNRWP